MSENKYTPEPWRAFNNGEGVVGVGTDHSDVCWTRIEEGGWLNSDRTIDADYENARRIVACVNACEDILDYELSLGCVARLSEQLRTITKQRDELLAATEAIAINSEECLDFDECTAMLVSIDDYHKLMEAVARAKGEQ